MTLNTHACPADLATALWPFYPSTLTLHAHTKNDLFGLPGAAACLGTGAIVMVKRGQRTVQAFPTFVSTASLASLARLGWKGGISFAERQRGKSVFGQTLDQKREETQTCLIVDRQTPRGTLPVPGEKYRDSMSMSAAFHVKAAGGSILCPTSGRRTMPLTCTPRLQSGPSTPDEETSPSSLPCPSLARHAGWCQAQTGVHVREMALNFCMRKACEKSAGVIALDVAKRADLRR
ncbi:hypothetical protein BJV74DRAFT_796478 [Russula compacta]|nr:hypothetical protein BJV74DRAFT_796478 [Russula compacta]